MNAGATVSRVHLRTFGVPVFPALSSWRTENVCGPGVAAVTVAGEVHAVHAPPSSWHMKPTAAFFSDLSPTIVIFVLVSLVNAGNCPVTVGVPGGMRSVVQK